MKIWSPSFEKAQEQLRGGLGPWITRRASVRFYKKENTKNTTWFVLNFTFQAHVKTQKFFTGQLKIKKSNRSKRNWRRWSVQHNRTGNAGQWITCSEHCRPSSYHEEQNALDSSHVNQAVGYDRVINFQDLQHRLVGGVIHRPATETQEKPRGWKKCWRVETTPWGFRVFVLCAAGGRRPAGHLDSPFSRVVATW